MSKKSKYVQTPFLCPNAYRLRRISLLILGLGVSAFAPVTWAAPCTAGDTAACSAAGGTHANERGGDGGAGNGQGGGSTTVVGPFIVNNPGAQSTDGEGDGGDGATGISGGGAGGTGGLTAGLGGNQGNPGQSGAVNFAGGGGGGGSGIYATLDTAVGGPLNGGQGGAGGTVDTGSAVAGGGGGGGAGLVAATGATSIINNGSITGGTGGAGGDATGSAASAGGGGGGGDGVLMLGTTNATFTNKLGAVVTGGMGGLAGLAGPDAFGGLAGASGAGVNLAAPAQVLINDGTISGGASTAAGTGGSAGAAIISFGDNNQITNSGTLNGGVKADSTHALAVDIEANKNLVSLDPGSVVNGDLLSNGSSNQLNLLPGNHGTLASNITGFSGISALTGANWELSGAQSLTRDLTVDTIGGGTLLISGAMTGTGDLVLFGGGLTLSDVNTYSGGTGIGEEAQLALSGAGTLGAGALTIATEGVLDISQSTAATVAISSMTDAGGDAIRLGNRNLILGAGNSVSDVKGVITDGGINPATGGSVTIAPGPAGSVTFEGVNTYSGGTTVSSGTLALAGAGTPGTGGVSMDANTTLDISQTTLGVVLHSITDTGAGATIKLGSRSLSLSSATDYTFGGVIADGGISGTTGGSVTISGNNGSVTFSGANSYTGGTSLEGTLKLAGNGSLDPTGAVSINAGGLLDISGADSGASIGSLGGNGTVTLGAKTLTVNNANNAEFDGLLSGAGGSLIKQGSGSLVLTEANTYTGGTTINDGIVNLDNLGSLDADSAVTVNGTGRLDISGIAGTGTSIGDLSGNGSVNVGHKLLTINGAGDTIMDGVISGPTGGIVKSGAGTMVLNGANTYTGSTTLLAGRLFIGNAPGSAQITSDVTTAGGTTLAGYGQILGSVNVAAQGHLAPGSIDGMGTLSTRDLTMASGSTLEFDAGAPGSPGTFGLSDHVSVDGNLTLQGVTLNVNDAGSFGPGVYNVFSYTGALDDGDDDGLVLGGIPASSDVVIQNLTAQKQINLVNATGATLRFWDANNLAGPGQMGGGDGTWSTTSVDWTDSTGAVIGAMQPQPSFAVFGGAPGSVTVDDTAGAVGATGIQFDSDGYILKGGTLTLVAGAGHPAPVEVRVGDGSSASMGWTATINNVITGVDGLAKTGAGTLVLTGANTYTGGTFVQAGELSVDKDAELGDASGALALNGGALRVTGTAFNQTARTVTLGGNGGGFDIADATNTFTLDQALSGNGGLNKLGAGTLLMTADNTYTGGTTISAGTLQVGDGGNSGSIVGDVANNGTLVFNRADSVVFDGAMSGSGKLTQAGSGSLNLTGDSSAFTGTSNVAAGTLIVDGKLGGGLSVASGATLAGIGSVGNTTLAGGSILAPGNSASPIGTLTVNGNLSIASGTVYQVQADPTGTSSDLVHVTGTAHLAGSVVHIGPDGNFAPSQTYTILTADGGVTGTFDSVASNFAFLAPTLTYDPNDAFLTLKRNNTTFVSLAQTSNQRAVAGALDSMAASAALPSAVSTVAAAQAPGTFDALSGEIHPSTTSVLQSISQAIASMPLDHLHNSLSAGWVNGPATAQLGAGDSSALPGSAAQPVWAQVFGNWRTLGGNGNAGPVSESDGGLFVGADRGVGAGWRLGGALGYTGSHSSLNDRNSTSNVDSYSASIYGGKAFQAGPGKINLMLGTAYTWNDIHTKRQVGVAGLDQTLKANYGASTGQVFTELGYALPLNERVTVEPFLGAAWSDLRTRGFAESGGSAGLDGEGNRNDVTTTTLGLHGKTTFLLQQTQGSLHATVGWRHAFGDVTPETTMAFDGGQSFTVAGAPIAHNAAVLELGADVAVAKNTTVGVAYNGQFGAGNQQNAGSVNVSWRF